MEEVFKEDEINQRIKALVTRSVISPPQLEQSLRIRNSFLIPQNIGTMSVDEIDRFTYWLSKQDEDQRGRDTLRGSSRSEKWALVDFIIQSQSWLPSEASQVIQLQDFPDFILLKEDKPFILIEIARVTHQAIEEFNSTTTEDRLWSPGKPFEVYSTTSIVRYNKPDERYKPHKVVQGIANGDMWAEWIPSGTTELQCAQRAYNELRSKVQLFNSLEGNFACNVLKIIILDIALEPYGLGTNLQVVRSGLSHAIKKEPELTNWLHSGGKIYLRVQRINTASVPYFQEI